MTENYITKLFPVDVGRTREEIWDSLDHHGVYKGEGVVLFFADSFKRPEERQSIDLVYTTPSRLGFVDPPDLSSIWKKIESEGIKLGECPEETAASLLDGLLDKTDSNSEYYPVSIKFIEDDKTNDQETDVREIERKDKENRIASPELLKIVRRKSGRLDVLGWSKKDLIPLDGILVFKQGTSRTDLTNL